MPTLSKMSKPLPTILVRDVYKVGLNVWAFSLNADRSRHFPVGTITKVTIPDGGSETLQHEYPGDKECPVITVQHDNNEGNIARDYRLDLVLIVEDIRSDDVIDAVNDGIDAVLAYGRYDIDAALSLYQSPADGDEPEQHRRDIRTRCDTGKRQVSQRLRETVLTANREGFPHDMPNDGLVHVPTGLYDKLWAVIDHKVQQGKRLEGLIKDGTLTPFQVPQADLAANLPDAFGQFLEFHEETIQNMAPPTRPVMERMSHRTAATPTTNDDTQQLTTTIERPSNTAIPSAVNDTTREATTEEQKPAPVTIDEPHPQDDDEVTEIDETTAASIEHLSMTNVPEKLHPEIEPDSVPNVHELRELYDAIQPAFSGMYDIADGKDPRAPLLCYATWIIYLVALQSTSRSKLLGKEWYTINQDSLKLFDYGMSTAMAYVHHADPEKVVENTEATQGKALTYMSTAMNTLLSAGMGLLKPDVRDNLDAVVRNVTTGTIATSSIKKDLTTFLAGDVNNKLPESIRGWLRCGHILAKHVNRQPPIPKQKAPKHAAKTKNTTTTAIKRKDVGSPADNKIPKKMRPPPPTSPRPKDHSARAAPKNPTVASLPEPDQNTTASPSSVKTTTKSQPRKTHWVPPSSLADDFGPPGYLRVCSYLYLKTTRTTRERFEEWMNVFRAYTKIYDDVAKEIADHADEMKLDPDTVVFPVEDDARVCFMHPLIRDVYVGSIPKDTQEFDIEHAAKFCKNMGDTAGCLTLSHQPMYGLTNKIVQAAGLERFEETIQTDPYYHQETIQEDLEALRATWNKKQSAK